MSRDASIQSLVDSWAQEYSERTGRELHVVDDHGFSYVYDIEGGRVVCVSGRSLQPGGPRDRARQSGSPPPGLGDHRGHLIAHSMGGGMDINLFDQSARLNIGHGWRSIERYASAHPGTPIAIRLQYRDDSDRPSEIEYARVDAQRGLLIDRFANVPARDLDRAADADRRAHGPASPGRDARQRDRTERRERR